MRTGRKPQAESAPTRRPSAEVVALPTARRAVVSEFQSDAVEIEERPPPRLARLMLYAIAGLIAAAVTWASLSRVDEVAVATGKLVTTQPNLVVQPLETSVIRTIDVAIGDTVHAGDVLATLDTTFTQSDVEQLRSKVATIDAEIARLEAELAGKDFELLADAASPSAATQARLFAQRKAFRDAKLKDFATRIAQAEATLATSQAEEAVLVKRLATVREIEAMRNTLMQNQNGSKLNYLQSLDVRLEIDAALSRLRGSQVELQHAIEKGATERQAFLEELRRTAIEDLVKARDQHNGAAEELKKAELRRSLVVLTAPAEAVVLDIAQRSIGSVVREAEPLFTLVPLHVPIEAEMSIEAKDIGHVTVGDSVRIKLDAFPFQKHGTISGTLRTISRDAFSTPHGADKQEAGPLIYRARVALTNTQLRSAPSSFRIIPGMNLTGEIKVGQRSVISYFLYPLLRGLDESIREP
ncbi:HlyD family type I secretion periplasmic adaptor subunit [Chelatococcus sp. GCM10030263]|uniref:HlyD family type I secretion periplasmic adaptor subunit n=1 Tax=Chelatococcus sp. GCM10030263 TaxID=3273387 RepID=UPI003614F685